MHGWRWPCFAREISACYAEFVCLYLGRSGLGGGNGLALYEDFLPGMDETN